MTRPDLDSYEMFIEYTNAIGLRRDLRDIIAYARELEQTRLPSVQAWGKFKAAERRIKELERVLEPICQTIIDPLVADAKRVLENRP